MTCGQVLDYAKHLNNKETFWKDIRAFIKGHFFEDWEIKFLQARLERIFAVRFIQEGTIYDCNNPYNKVSSYQKGKTAAYQKAIDWQADFCNHNYSYGELAYYQNYFEKLGRRYGLLKEFRENAIC